MSFAERSGIALVVGGTGGVGSAVVRSLAAAGADVVFTYRSSETAATALAAELEPSPVAVKLDVTDSAAVAAAVAAIAEDGGGIHTVVHAAGPKVPQIHLSRVEPSAFEAALQAETAGFFAVAHAALPTLRASGGSIVAVTTAATDRYAVRDGLSAAPKAAIETLVRGLAAEEGRFGVRCNAVGPGMLEDGMAATLMAEGHYDQAALDAATANIAMRRFGTCQDVADAVVFLASDRASYVSGQILNVDGGYTA